MCYTLQALAMKSWCQFPDKNEELALEGVFSLLRLCYGAVIPKESGVVIRGCVCLFVVGFFCGNSNYLGMW